MKEKPKVSDKGCVGKYNKDLNGVKKTNDGGGVNIKENIGKAKSKTRKSKGPRQ